LKNLRTERPRRLLIEVCPYWNGKKRVCDITRCRKLMKDDCYHKPFLINGKRKTVKEAVLIVLQVDKSVYDVSFKKQRR